MPDIYMTKNDLRPPVQAALKYEDGSAVVLTDVSVKFIMVDSEGTVKVNASASIVDAPNGKVKYDWQSGDTDTEGIFTAEFEVTFPDGKKQTFPSKGDFTISIRKEKA